MIRLLSITISFFILVSPLCADTHTASSCSDSDIQAAVNAAGDGDTVIVPAGNCTFISAVTVDLSAGKSLTILGNNCTLDGNGRPISCPTNITSFGFDFTGADGKAWRLANMTMKGSAGVTVWGESKNWRIDHIYFDTSTGHTSGRVIWIQPTGSAVSYTAGVIDHCTFYHPQVPQLFHVSNTISAGNGSWAREIGLGGPDAVYVEDCIFDHPDFNASRPIMDGRGEGYVFRHNQVTNGYLEMHDAIVGNFRGLRKWEIYENTFTNTGTKPCTNLHLRGGTGVAFNNSFVGKANCDDGIEFHLYRTYQTGGDPWTTLCGSSSGTAYLDTTATYPRNCSSGAGCVNKDGAGINGYPCRDQIGTTGNGVQTIVPALLWNNKYCATAPCTPNTNVSLNMVSGASYYTSGRDYCIGTTSMPATCNGRTQTYTPYAYPHPLVYVPSPPPSTQ